MRATTIVPYVFLLTLIAVPAGANICAHDNVPAATLLFPFVAHDYNDPGFGLSTIMSITNMSWESQIVHVTFWTDYGEPMVNFNIILTGYDLVEFSTSDILGSGQLPVTQWNTHQGAEGVQDRGPMSSANTLHTLPPVFMEPPLATNALGDRCNPANTAYPGLYVTPIPQSFLDIFQGWLQVSQTHPRYYSDDCTLPYGSPYIADPPPWFQTRTTDTPTWFYVTVDVVEYCQRNFPDFPGYFDTIVRPDNVLVGEVLWVSGNSITAAPAVHIEADIDLAAVATTHLSGRPVSFYHRYSAFGGSGPDYREPLPTAWSVRYRGIGTDFIGTSFFTWKGSTGARNPLDLELQGSVPLPPDQLVATNCLAYTYFAWDEEENVVSVSVPAIELNLLPLATQQIQAETLQLSGSDGWALFVWPPFNWTSAAAGPPDIWQTWMGSTVDYPGAGKAYLPATATANYGCYSNQGPPFFGVDYDYVGPDGYTSSPGVKARRSGLGRVK